MDWGRERGNKREGFVDPEEPPENGVAYGRIDLIIHSGEVI